MKENLQELRDRLRLDIRFRGVPGEDEPSGLYRRMYYIRRFEERLLALFAEGRLNGTIHACIGQEANCVAVIRHLSQDDHLFSNHRCHGHFLAHTGDGLGMLLEMMGSDGGVCRGLGGSQHLAAPGFKSNGVLGGTVPAAAGIAFSFQLKRSWGISVVFMGDGALGEGVVYETMNIASLWGLPLFFVVENNGWSQSTPIRVNLAGEVAARFSAFGIPVREITSTDVEELSRCAEAELQELRRHRSPRALIINTYRLCSHSKNDDNRPREEVAARWEVEPLKIQSAKLSVEALAKVAGEVEGLLDEIFAHARDYA